MQAAADQDKLISEKTFLLMVPLSAIAALVCLAYTFTMAPGSRYYSWCYGVISFLSLLIYRWYRNFNIFRTVQLTLILLLPCLLHLALGNFVSSSAVIIWAILCPLGALAFQNSKTAGYWLICVHHLHDSWFFSLEDKLAVNETHLPDELVSFFLLSTFPASHCLCFFCYDIL
jgi:hypothetical protein